MTQIKGDGSNLGGSSNGGGGDSGTLSWYRTCGDPVCMGEETFDSQEIDNCTDETEGEPCDEDGARCDGVFDCGATLVCAASDPTQGPGGCPISGAARKRDIRYLSAAARRRYADELRTMALAEYYYKDAPNGPLELGFLIDDLEPSVAVRGDRVNLYGTLSMAIATLQLQHQELEALGERVQMLERELVEKERSCDEAQAR